MPKPPRAWLVNYHGRVSIHVFTRLRTGKGGLYVMYRCMDTERERVYGCMRPEVNRSELEALFGPLDDELRSSDASTRKVA